MAQSTFRPDVEGLRAVAVLGVLAFHCGLPLRGGFVGVDVFFVLSGYLITSLLLREVEASGTIALLDFYARRARRLLPAATLVTLTTLVLLLSFAPEAMQSDFALDASAAAAYFANWHFAARSVDYLSEDLGRSPFLHFWSLSVEEQFYFAWPALIALGAKVSGGVRLPPRRALGSIATVITIASFGVAVTRSESSSADFFETTKRAWELGVGALFAFAPPLVFGRVGLNVLSVSGIGLIAAAYAQADANHWPSLRTLGPTLGTALLLWVGTFPRAAEVSLVHRALTQRPLVWLGGLSYSLYLWHWPLLVLGQDWLELKGPLFGTLLTIASLLPAWLSYRFVEAPVRASALLVRSPGGSVSVGLNLSLLAIALGLGSSRWASPDSQVGASSVYLGVRNGHLTVDPPKAGALALGRTPRKSGVGKPKASYPLVTPDPELAPMDVPRAYLEGCQVPTGVVEPKWCKIGAEAGSLRGIMVGDSKILQYYEALDAVGQVLGIEIRSATKSACAFARVFGGDASQDDDECLKFTDAVLEEIRRSPPEFVITGQRDRRARITRGPKEQTKEEMILALQDIWGELRSLGSEVIVVVDNPGPEEAVYQCLIDHPDNALPCAFNRREGALSSAALVQREAAMNVPGVRIIDPTDFICPREKCAPVIGNVLIYRQGSHITNTYARTLSPFFEREFRRILDDRARGVSRSTSDLHP